MSTNTSKQVQDRLSYVLAILFRSSPFFANLLPFIRIKLVNDKREVPIGACTRDGTILLNTEFFMTKDEVDIVAVILHEIMHLVTGDFQRSDRLYQELQRTYKTLNTEYFHKLCNLVSDVINNYLLSEGFNVFEESREQLTVLQQTTGIKDLHKEDHIRKLLENASSYLQNQSQSNSNNNNEYIVITWDNNSDSNSSNSNQQDQQGQQDQQEQNCIQVSNIFEGFAVASLISPHNNCSSNYKGDMIEREPKGQEIWRGKHYDKDKWTNDTERKALVRAALVKAKEAGDTPLGLYTYLEQLVQPKIKWNKYVSRLVTHHIQVWVGTYQRRSRRQLPVKDIRLPGIKTYGFKCIIAIDTSGSIGLEELKTFVSEIYSLVKRYNATDVIVVPFDAKAYDPIYIRNKSDVNKLKELPGGGGTCIKPFFDKMKKIMSPLDTIVIFTDGYIFDIDKGETISYLRRYKPIVVTSDKEILPGILVNVKVQ